MTIKHLDWHSLLPNLAPFHSLFSSASQLPSVTVADTQPRLNRGLKLFTQTAFTSPFMLIKAEENREYLAHIADMVNQYLPTSPPLLGVQYHIDGDTLQVNMQPAQQATDNFAAQASCLYEDWVESEQLLGCLRHHKEHYLLQPGMVHQVNGGVLILSLRTLLAQPHMWLRLKQIVQSQCYQWYSTDEARPIPLQIPAMPINLRVILVGNRESLAEFQLLEPEIESFSPYGEFEKTLTVKTKEQAKSWCQYINHLISKTALPPLAHDAWPELIRYAIRYYSGEHSELPLCPVWLINQLKLASVYHQGEITAESFVQAVSDKIWRESYLLEKSREEFEEGQIFIATEGEDVGQINGLSVLEYPGHPLPFGEPTRITCTVHLGDGEITDVERKTELAGNIHAKGMMIMQSYLISELGLDHPFPFSASIVFEQSYGEVDGDSASLAELCVLISSLSLQPIAQNIAVTGSVDQFGQVQPVGGINEKIEGFFALCQYRGLTGNHGVIIPSRNLSYLCLQEEIVNAVKEGLFHIWAVDSVADALPILIGLPYQDPSSLNLLSIIQERINQIHSTEKKSLPWGFQWINWFK